MAVTEFLQRPARLVDLVLPDARLHGEEHDVPVRHRLLLPLATISAV